LRGGGMMRKDNTMIPELKKGDLFYTSWGYDQTNYDYVAVIAVSKTGKTAKCSMTQFLHMGSDGHNNVQEPIFCPAGKTFNLRIKKSGDSIYLVGSYPFCQDSRRRGYFSRVDTGKQFHETDALYGH
jgi:hypothetical protein